MGKKRVAAVDPLGKRIRKYWPLMVMMLPAVILLIVFNYIPMAGILMAFEDYKIKLGLFGSEFVGLKNFAELFASNQFWQVIGNTLYISLLKLFLGFFPPILFALLLKEVKIPWFRKLTQTFSYLPYFISWIIMAGIIKEMFSTNGVFNQIIAAFGVEPQVWLSIKSTFVPIMVGTDIWKNFGWNSIIYFSALSAIDPVFYEAASLDGASRLKMATRITLPCLIPTIAFIAYDIRFYNQSSGMAGGVIFFVLCALGILSICMLLHLFPVLARFETQTKALLKSSFILVFRYFRKTMLMLSVLVIYVIAVINLPPLPLLLFGVWIYFNCCIEVSMLDELEANTKKTNESAE